MPRRATFVSKLLVAAMAFVALSATEAAAGSTFVYALRFNHGIANRIYGFRLDRLTGALTALPGFPVSTGGTGAFGDTSPAIAYGNGRLYVVNNGDHTLSAFSVNRSTGALTALPFSPIALGAASAECLAVHPSGSPVAVGVGNGFVASFVVTATTATPASGSPFATADTPRPQGLGPPSCHFSRDGRYFYAGGYGTGISGYSVVPSTGVLTTLVGSPFPFGDGNPLAYATDDSGRFFSMNCCNGGLRAFTIADGALTAVTGNPFPFGAELAGGVHGVLHPAGFYMVADIIRSRVRVFRIEGSGAGTTLTPVAGSPFRSGGSLTHDLAITPDGGLLVASNFLSRNLRVFRANAGSGGLTSVFTQPVGALGSSFTAGVALVRAPTLGDLDTDTHADLLWRNKATGQNIGWLMNGTTVTNAALVSTIADTNWEIKGTGDFDADGRADVIWRNVVTGQNIGWLMDGLTVSFSAFLPTIADTNWEIDGVGDFDGDARADVIFRNKATGENLGWLMAGTSVSSTVVLPTIADANWEIAGVGDVDGDARADVIWRNKATGQNIAWLMNGLTVSLAAFLPTIADTNWEIRGVGDLDADGKADVVWRNKVTGENIGWLMNGAAVASSAFLTTIADTNWEIKGVRDANGDGRSDVVWRNKVTGQNIAWLMNGFTISTAAFLPTIADTNWDLVGGASQ